MKAFNNSNKSSTTSTSPKAKSACSYCGDTEHQVTKCPNAVTDWAYFRRFEIPCMDTANWTNNPKPPAQGQRWNAQDRVARWFKDPSGWSKWYSECEKAVGKIEAYKLREAKKANVPKAKRAKSCGFCGGVGHNRRDCAEMTALNDRLIKANAHWRQRLYDYFVKELGLGNGALVKVSKNGGWQQPTTEHVAIITSINWDELNMFCYTEGDKRRWSSSVHDHLRAPMQIKAVVDGKETEIQWAQQKGNNNPVRMVCDTHGRPLVDNWSHNWNSATFTAVMSPTKMPLSEEWLTQGQQECVQFITKKYSLAKLTDWKAIEILENYEKRYNLK